MRRVFFFIVAAFCATTSFASIPRASMHDRASEHASAFVDPLSETRVWASEVLAPFERPAETELTRALHRAYADSSTTGASGLGRFLSVDPVMDIKQAMRNPQGWNRYAYVMNNPINRIDPDGRCSRPTTLAGSSTVGLCIEGFIGARKVGGVGDGDGRGHAANDPSKTNRVQVQITVNTQSGKIVATTRASESTASAGSIMLARGLGSATTTLSNATRGADGTIGFTVRTSAMNGLSDKPGAPKDAIDFKMNILVTPNGRIGLAPGGRTDGYPSIGAYGYTPAGATVRLYESHERNADDLAAPMEVPIPAVPPH